MHTSNKKHISEPILEEIGFPGYLAPEMVAGGRYTEKIDVYLLGLILHELLVQDPAVLIRNSEDTILSRDTLATVARLLSNLSRDKLVNSRAIFTNLSRDKEVNCRAIFTILSRDKQVNSRATIY